MENTPMVCADDSPSILGNLKSDPKSRSANSFLQRLDFYPISIKVSCTSQSSAQTGKPIIPVHVVLDAQFTTILPMSEESQRIVFSLLVTTSD